MNKSFKNITDKLKSKDYRLTDIRKAVIKVLTLKEHVSVNDIILFLEKENSKPVNIMSIYNTIDLLMAEHIIHANVFADKQIIYELTENSIHIICNICNENMHVPVFTPEQQNSFFQFKQLEKLINQNHLSFSHYKLEIHGICDKCKIKYYQKT